jgi:hypothetical protein
MTTTFGTARAAAPTGFAAAARRRTGLARRGENRERDD